MVKPVKYLFLDLDGTLINFNLKIFIQKYLHLIQDNFAHLLFAKSVPDWIMTGTGIMLSSVETITNKDKFVHYFKKKSGMSEKEIWEIFLHFYNTDYNKLEEITKPMPGAKTFLQGAVSEGYELILATQPVFPEVAIRNRLKWAGLEQIPFRLITHIENMYASKPHKEYFEQILKMLNTRGKQCMMIGNDVEMDMAAKNSGIYTYYLITDSLANHDEIENADYSGDYNILSDLLNILRKEES